MLPSPNHFEKLIVFEDEHLLVVNKPAGLNTHAPSPYAGEGLYEWLKNREPRWDTLAIIHRLDKETSGLMVFGKTTLANRSLTEQFSERKIHKKYLLLATNAVSFQNLVAESSLVRSGDKYLSRPQHAGGENAETRFQLIERTAAGMLIEAEPITGRTHQIRVHAAAYGFPILGDTLYGGEKSSRVCLHAAELRLQPPETGEQLIFNAPPDFQTDARLALRESIIDAHETNAFRLIHGAADGWPGWFVEKLGGFLLSQSGRELSEPQRGLLASLARRFSAQGVYHKILNRHVRGTSTVDVSPQLILGEKAPEEFIIRENGVPFALRFTEGYSVGIFLDQRENRRRFLTSYVAPDFFWDEPAKGSESSPRSTPLEVLNTFSYTCGFSVCAAKAGARVTSIDLSKKYLEWGKRSFALNNLDPAQHDFIYGDVFDWMRRLGKKQRRFDAVILDPPTFSQSKESGVFRAENDYGKLVAAALPLLNPNGVLLASTNAAMLPPEDFLEMVKSTITSSRRKILHEHYVPQPIDFPVTKLEPAYLKTVWLRVE